MEDKKLFLIGEVVKMFHISMGTLRHYEQAGLLIPEYADPDTGYRYYGTRQFELELISRKIDHRLEQLRDSLHSKTYLDLENSIRKLVENQKESPVFMGKIGIGISREQLLKRSFQDYDRIFLFLDQEERYDGETETFPRQTCVTIHFCGSHREAPAYY